jgi:hypothetical protein
VDLSARRRYARLREAFPNGVAAVRDLVTYGIPERTAYERCLEGGPWQRVLPGIVLLFTGRPTIDQLTYAALLLGGPEKGPYPRIVDTGWSIKRRAAA